MANRNEIFKKFHKFTPKKSAFTVHLFQPKSISMCKLSDIEMRSIRNGDDTPFGRLYAENYTDLVVGLRSKTKSQRSIEDIEDAIQDAFFVVRRKIKDPNFRNDNICGYIVNIGYNKLLDVGKKMGRMQGFEVDEIERYITRVKGIHDEDFSPKFSNLNDQQHRQVDAILKVWENFGDACKRLLEALWMEEKKLKDVWQELGHSSYDVAKTTKSRCVKNLRKKVNDLLNIDKQAIR